MSPGWQWCCCNEWGPLGSKVGIYQQWMGSNTYQGGGFNDFGSPAMTEIVWFLYLLHQRFSAFEYNVVHAECGSPAWPSCDLVLTVNGSPVSNLDDFSALIVLGGNVPGPGWPGDKTDHRFLFDDEVDIINSWLAGNPYRLLIWVSGYWNLYQGTCTGLGAHHCENDLLDRLGFDSRVSGSDYQGGYPVYDDLGTLNAISSGHEIMSGVTGIWCGSTPTMSTEGGVSLAQINGAPSKSFIMLDDDQRLLINNHRVFYRAYESNDTTMHKNAQLVWNLREWPMRDMS